MREVGVFWFVCGFVFRSYGIAVRVGSGARFGDGTAIREDGVGGTVWVFCGEGSGVLPVGFALSRWVGLFLVFRMQFFNVFVKPY